jgi:hypothetical protein
MYQKGKIYKLISDETDKIYIGSTCNPLNKRLSQHKFDYKNPEKMKTIKNIFKTSNFQIILIEDYACERKEQLHARERYYIELNRDICCNIILPSRSSKEYRESTKEAKAIYDKTYRKQYRIQYVKDNKEKINEYANRHTECECGGNYLWKHKARHLRCKKHQSFIQSQS